MLINILYLVPPKSTEKLDITLNKKAELLKHSVNCAFTVCEYMSVCVSCVLWTVHVLLGLGGGLFNEAVFFLFRLQRVDWRLNQHHPKHTRGLTSAIQHKNVPSVTAAHAVYILVCSIHSVYLVFVWQYSFIYIPLTVIFRAMHICIHDT